MPTSRGRLEDVVLIGLRADQPLATEVAEGTTYSVEDEDNLVERSDGTTWVTWAGAGGGGGSGTVTNTGTLTVNLPVVGNSGVDVKILAAGTALQVLRMNAGATAVEFATAGTGDVVGPAASVDKEIALFDGTTGKLLERATGTGYVKVTSGVMGTPAATVPVSTDVGGLGTGVATALGVNVGSAGAPVVQNGALGTPSSGTATNLTGLPLTTGVTGTLPIASGGTANTTATAAFDALAPTTTAGDTIYHNGSDNVRLGIGTALQVLRTNAGATAPEWATLSGGGNVNAGGTLTSGAIVIGQGSTDVATTATGTGVVTALGVNVGSAGAVVVNGGALGTPASGTLTNATGLPTILAANEATDTSCFPAFFTAATGELGPKTNASLTYNSNTGAFSIGTTAPLTVGTVELGAAADTTLSRASAGVLAVEGVNVLTTATGQPLDATLTALAAYNTNGLITQTAADTFTGRTVTGTTAQISVANGDGVAGNPTLSLPADVLIPTVLTVPNTGLHLLDTNASHDLIIAPGSNLTADHTLTVVTGDADRSFTLTADSSIGGTAYVAGGTDVAVADGGTNLSSYTTGDILYASAGTTLSKLGIGTALQVLRTNAGATAPEWAAASGGGLTYTAGGADAAQTMAVNTLYYVDISGYTADRTYTLPGTAAVGDICAIAVTTGDTAFELLITAASGDTLNGIAGGTEWSRLFIQGESVYMTCVAANAAWVVTTDGRIPQSILMRLSTNATGESANTVTVPTSSSGVFTADINVGSGASTSDSRLYARRAGNYLSSFQTTSVNSLSTAATFAARYYKNGTTDPVVTNTYVAPSATAGRSWATLLVPLAAGDYLQATYVSSEGSKGLSSSASPLLTGSSYSMAEVL